MDDITVLHDINLRYESVTGADPEIYVRGGMRGILQVEGGTFPVGLGNLNFF